MTRPANDNQGDLFAALEAERALIAERLMARIEYDTNGGCWLWTGALRKGYGAVKRRRGCVVDAHRLSWEVFRGPIRDGQHVLHRCDVPPCVNPSHLFLGTNADNVADMVRKGRAARGERCGGSRLTADVVLEMRRLRATGAHNRDIAAHFGIGSSLASQVLLGRIWRHLLPVANDNEPAREGLVA